jgi:hypothetical protein
MNCGMMVHLDQPSGYQERISELIVFYCGAERRCRVRAEQSQTLKMVVSLKKFLEAREASTVCLLCPTGL